MNANCLALFLLLAFTGCTHTAPPIRSAGAGHVRWAEPVKPDANLYRIDDGLYRSEQLSPADVGTLETLGIKSVINLRYFDRNDNETVLAGRNVKLLNSPLLTWRIKPEHIARTLYMIEQNQQNGAVLIHCYHGADRTGLIAAMYRIIYQGWTVEEAKAEMQQGSYGFHSIWKNLSGLLTPATVSEVKARLNRLRAENKNKTLR